MTDPGLEGEKTAARPRRRRLNPADRRSELLEAALRVLRSRGLPASRVEDVTEAAGAAKGTFYLYFGSWDELLIALRTHLLSTYVGEMRLRFAAAGRSDWWNTFEDECVRFVDFIVGLGGIHEAVFHGPAAARPIEAALSAEAVIVELLEKGIREGLRRPARIDAAARLLFAILHTTADAVKGDARRRNIDTMLDLLRAWLKPARLGPGEGGRSRLRRAEGGSRRGRADLKPPRRPCAEAPRRPMIDRREEEKNG